MSAGIYSYKTLFWGLAAALLAACGGGGGGNGGGSGPPPANLAPTASFTATPSSGTAPLTVAFNASASSDSDGSTGGGSMVSHTYTGAGSFTARLTVTDNGGLAASTTRVITVNAAPPPTGGAFNNTANVKSPLGTNLMRPADFSNEFPFVDHMKQAREWFSGKPFEFQDGAALAKDADGWPNNLASGQVARTVIFSGPDPGNVRPGQRFVVLKSGDGELEHGNVEVVSQSTARDVIALRDGLWILTINRTTTANPLKIRLVPEGGICTNNPLAKVASAAACAGGDFKSFEAADAPRFTPEFLNSIKTYSHARFLDWGHINKVVDDIVAGTPDLVSFSDRPKVNDATWTRGLRHVPVEIMVELCNFMNMDMWFHVHHKADDAYVQGVATILRDQLEPGRKVYVEYTNEVWNGIFDQTPFAAAEGRRLGLHLPEDNEFIGTIRFYAKRATEVMKIFKTVFGAGTSTRVVRVAATLMGNGFAIDTILGFEDTAANMDAFAIAPYFGDTAGDGTFPVQNRGGRQLTGDEEIAKIKSLGVDGVFSWLLNDNQPDLFGSLADIRFNTVISRDAALGFGKPLISYEGGQHFLGAGSGQNDNALNAIYDSVNRDPRMKQVYAQYLNGWRDDTGQFLTHYFNCDAWSVFGRWGSLEFSTQPRAQAPKFDALQTYIETRPLS